MWDEYSRQHFKLKVIIFYMINDNSALLSLIEQVKGKIECVVYVDQTESIYHPYSNKLVYMSTASIPSSRPRTCIVLFLLHCWDHAPTSPTASTTIVVTAAPENRVVDSIVTAARPSPPRLEPWRLPGRHRRPGPHRPAITATPGNRTILSDYHFWKLHIFLEIGR
jgi:hypothetical protein